VAIDIGTGDGRLPYALARQEPDRLCIGLDANAANLRHRSGRALRDRMANVLYVRAAVEDLPPELAGVADRLSIVLPWGSLLAAVALPHVDVLRGIRGLCQPGATLSVVLGLDPSRDRAELARLGIKPLDGAFHNGDFAAAYAAAGFRIESVRSVDDGALAAYPSTWARQLAHGRERRFVRIEAEAV
jgi:16S rRNA (adenine(1408)-N(1))-methyltransferase